MGKGAPTPKAPQNAPKPPIAVPAPILEMYATDAGVHLVPGFNGQPVVKLTFLAGNFAAMVNFPQSQAKKIGEMLVQASEKVQVDIADGSEDLEALATAERAIKSGLVMP